LQGSGHGFRIESLDGHTAFIFDKINFLMDAIIGFINISQSKVVKIFSVAAVAMLPPTLIASIYGMNFEYMPELSQKWGYAPSETHWWQHGHSSERDFIYVTTQNISAEQLQALSGEVGPEQSLLVCCAAFHGVSAAKAAERCPNLTLKKIPKMVLARCHWGRDDYSLNVTNLPMAEPLEKMPPPQPSPSGRGRKAREATADLFGDGWGQA